MSDAKDTEIILGTGKMLAIFFGLVAISGIFFGLGYTLGRSSSPMTLAGGQTTLVSSSGAKPGAGVTVTNPTVPADVGDPSPNPNAAANSQVDQTPPAGATSGADDAAANVSPTPTVTLAADQTVAKKTATPELAPEAGNITVQVAAVTKQEDAQALVAALRKKNYPVFVSPNASTDNLYHVQVGPFAEMKDAEDMKSKLAGDGYNAIVKK